MSYDEKTDRMDWRDEISWIVISIVSGGALSLLFLYFERFPGVNGILLFVLCCIGFYLLSILFRAQNQRGKVLAGKTRVKERYIKYIFPVLGFGIGLAIIFLN